MTKAEVPRRTYRRAADLDRQVLDQLRASNRPLGAYEIAQQSRQTASPLAPGQVYRIVERLLARGEIHRIELLSAYCPVQRDRPVFLVCKYCGSVEACEGLALAPQVACLCHARGFAPASLILEISGRCVECRNGEVGVPAVRRVRDMKIVLALLSLAGSAAIASPVEAAAKTNPIAYADLKSGKYRTRDRAVTAQRRLVAHPTNSPLSKRA